MRALVLICARRLLNQLSVTFRMRNKSSLLTNDNIDKIDKMVYNRKCAKCRRVVFGTALNAHIVFDCLFCGYMCMGKRK